MALYSYGTWQGDKHAVHYTYSNRVWAVSYWTHACNPVFRVATFVCMAYARPVDWRKAYGMP